MEVKKQHENELLDSESKDMPCPFCSPLVCFPAVLSSSENTAKSVVLQAQLRGGTATEPGLQYNQEWGDPESSFYEHSSAEPFPARIPVAGLRMHLSHTLQPRQYFWSENVCPCFVLSHSHKLCPWTLGRNKIMHSKHGWDDLWDSLWLAFIM